MTIYCSLHIRSEKNDRLPEELVLPCGDKLLKYIDHTAAERKELNSRLKVLLGRIERGPIKHHWLLSTEGIVTSFDINEHLGWIFDQLSPRCDMDQLKLGGYDCVLSLYWEGNGMGGGPRISYETAERLVKHRVSLQIGFYNTGVPAQDG
jgi:hypothetical protein